MKHRRVASRALIACAAVATVAALTSPAYAATALPANTPLLRSVADAYSFTTTLPYWTAVAVRPQSGADYDLQLVDPTTGGLLAGSYWGAGATDVIAINSNYRPLGGYLANVTKYSGTGRYSVMFREERVVIPVPTDPVGSTATALGLKFDWPVNSVQIYLRQGQGFRVYHSDVRVFLAGSTPGQPSTYLRSRTALENAYVIADNVASPGAGVCRVFMAPSDGWYAVILIWDTPWSPPPYNGGHAVFPQRYDPSKGDTLADCPTPQVP